MTRLIIARHGNTFDPGETPRRVGARTNLPLVQKGREQARSIGTYLVNNNLVPDVAYAAPLRRTMETAQIALQSCETTITAEPLDMFTEIDYGPDENKTEDEVIARTGRDAITAWDEKATVPPGWRADPEVIIENWLRFGEMISEAHAGQTVLTVTSNGIARFSPHLTGRFEEFSKKNALKISTGALCILYSDHKTWNIGEWNVRP